MSEGAVEASITQPDPCSVSATFVVEGKPVEVWFRSSVPLFASRSDAVLPLGLLAAMRTGRPLVVAGGISPRLLANASRAQDILASFSDHDLRATTIDAEPTLVEGTGDRGVGAFFSCGVDSFFTALNHADELTHLVFVRGFDILEVDSQRGTDALDSARRSAAELGLDLIEIETNLRELTETFAVWHLAHGPALGAVALLLQGRLQRILVPSGFSYRQLIPWGSHPLLDPLWGTELLTVEHDGTDATRSDKVAALTGSDTAMRHLRVCTNQFATSNCGRCPKCLRTMVILRLLGVLDRCPTFPPSLHLASVARLRLSKGYHPSSHHNLRTARESGDWRLAVALMLAFRPRPTLAVRRRLGDIRRLLSPRRRRARAYGPASVSRPLS